MHYNKIVRKHLINCIKDILRQISDKTIYNPYLCVRFYTNHHAVRFGGDRLNVNSSNPKHQETIILDRNFHNLMVFNDHFSVQIQIGKVSDTIQIPFDSISIIADIKQNFIIDLDTGDIQKNKQHADNLIQLNFQD